MEDFLPKRIKNVWLSLSIKIFPSWLFFYEIYLELIGYINLVVLFRWAFF